LASDVERRTVGLERVDASYAGDIVNCAKVAAGPMKIKMREGCETLPGGMRGRKR